MDLKFKVNIYHFVKAMSEKHLSVNQVSEAEGLFLSLLPVGTGLGAPHSDVSVTNTSPGNRIWGLSSPLEFFVPLIFSPNIDNTKLIIYFEFFLLASWFPSWRGRKKKQPVLFF